MAVIGGCGGIGSAVCEQLDRLGARVHPLDLPHFDATDHDQVSSWFRAHRGVDTVIYAAGLADSGPLCCRRGLAQLQELFAANVTGAVTVGQAAGDQLCSATGRFAVLSSAFSLVTADGYGAYSASKAALNMAARALRDELSPASVTTCLLGGVDTPIFRRAASRDPRPEAATVADRFTRRVARQSPDQAATAILDAVYQRRTDVSVGSDAVLVSLANRLVPRTTQRLVHRLVGPYPATLSEE